MNDPFAVGVYAFLFIALYFEVFLLISFLEKRPAPVSQKKLAYVPRVAVIVPCYNEERTVAKTIRSLLALAYPRDRLSIIVVDDGSTDGTHAIARRFEKRGVTVLRKENGGKHTALNYAIKRTDAELIGCLDADSFVETHALREMVAAFAAKPTIMATTPAILVHKAGTILELMQKAEYALSIFYRSTFGIIGGLFVAPGPFSFYRREVFERIGLFKAAYNTEDMEMAMRMQANRLVIANVHAAKVYTVVPRTLRSLLKQRVRWVQGFLQNSREYAHLYFNRRYGALGLLVLPTGLLSIFAALYLVAYSLYSLSSLLLSKIVEVGAIGAASSFSPPSLDWFFLNTSTAMVLIFFILPLTLMLLMMGKRLAGEKPFTIDIAPYFLLYGFIAPLWLAKAVWNTALARSGAWR